MHEASYVDDSAFPVFSEAEKLLSKIALTCQLVHWVFGLFGLAVNFKPGKTEAVIQFNGRRSAAMKRHLVHTLGMRIPLDLKNGEKTCLHCVAQYKHVGTNIALSNSMAPE
eukprot:4906919-Karenia_brevis.AAC.1